MTIRKPIKRYKQIVRTRRSMSQDMKRRSKQDWERGRGARRIGNPRYKPKVISGVKRYVLR